MSRTLGGNVGLVTCFRGVGALGLAAEQSFSESDQMIQIFTEKCPDLFGCGTDLTPKFGAKRTSFLAKRAGSLAKLVGKIIDGFTDIAFAKRFIDIAGKSLRRLAGGCRGLIKQLSCLPLHAVKYSPSLAAGGCVAVVALLLLSVWHVL